MVGPLPAVQNHQRYGTMLLPWAIALFVVAAAQWTWFRWGASRYHASRSGLATAAPLLLAVASASVGVGVGILILVVVTGDTGARAVWGGLLG